MGFTASLLGAQQNRDSVENKPASLLVVALGKTLNGIFQSDHFVLSTNFLFKFNVSLPLVTGELLQNTVDVNNVTYKLYNIKLQRLPVLLNTKNYLSTGQAITY